MAKRFVYLVLMVVTTGCSKVDEQLSGDHPDYLELTVQNIETNLPVVNFDVNEVEFDEMLQQYQEGLEVDADLFLYRNGQVVIEDAEVEIEVKGSHSAQFGMKSIGVKFDDTYDNSGRDLLDPPVILPFHNLDSIKAFRLRNSGNDFKRSMVKDLVYTQLAIDAGLDIDLMHGEQAVVFVNNEFYGVMELRSEGNTNGISRLYQTTSEETDLLKIHNPGEIEYKSGDETKLENYVNAVKNRDLAYLQAQTDLDNFIDYMIFQSFIANYDWPYNNVRIYSANDAPFRFILFDTDWCNTVWLNEEPLHFIDPEKENLVTDLFLLFHAEPGFRAQYEARYDEIISMPELKPAHFNQTVDFYANRIHDEMIYQVEKYQSPESMLDWYREIDILKMHYQKRYNYFHP